MTLEWIGYMEGAIKGKKIFAYKDLEKTKEKNRIE
jgi:hypothetical protein